MTEAELDVMDDFFIRMQGIYRNLWASAFTSEALLRQAQKEWLDTFYRAGLSSAQIADGILRCKQTFDKPPSPREFLAVLPRRRPEHQVHQAGLPEPEEHRNRRQARGKAQIQRLKAMLNQTKPNEDQTDE